MRRKDIFHLIQKIFRTSDKKNKKKNKIYETQKIRKKHWRKTFQREIWKNRKKHPKHDPAITYNRITWKETVKDISKN